MKSYDKTKIGPFVGWGGDHFVYEYGDDQVIKFSILSFLFGAKALRKATADYELCKKYLGNYVLDTEIAASPSGKYIVHLQPKIAGRPLLRSDLQKPKIKEAVKDLLHKHSLLVESEKYQVDLIGRDGMFNGGLTNIFITDDNELRIIDAMVLELSAVNRFLTPFLYTIQKIVLWRQRSCLIAFNRQSP